MRRGEPSGTPARAAFAALGGAAALLLIAPAPATADPCRQPLFEVTDLDASTGGGGGGGDDGESGVGGTGLAGDESGIGGTGLAGEGGIGGTGIYGTVTGFGSLCVNGLRVHYDASTSVRHNGRPAEPAALALGQVVLVIAERDGGAAGAGLRARSIEIWSALVGPVEQLDRVDGQTRALRVRGRRVRLSAATVRVGGAGALAPGQRVEVSGLPHPDGGLVASRIEPAAPGGLPDGEVVAPPLREWLATAKVATASLEGFVSEPPAERTLRLADVPVRSEKPLPPEVPTPGERVRVLAPVAPDGALRVSELRPARLRPPERPAPPERVRPPKQTRPPERPERPPDRLDRPVRPRRIDRPPSIDLQRAR